MESTLHKNPSVLLTGKKRLTADFGVKIKLVTVLLMLLSGYVKAQNAANYIFTPTTGTYTDLVGGTVVSALHVDDGTSTSLPLNFNFVFCGTTYTSVKACSNGWMTFGTTTSNTWTNSSANLGTLSPVLMPLWDDLGGQSGVSSQASYATTGTAPNRVFIFEWKNWRWQVGGGSAISFQAKLYETTNVIEYIYRQESGSLSSPSASIGIANTATDFQVLNNTSASPSTFTTNFNNYTSLATKPASNQVYRFSPPPPCTGKPAAGTVNALTPCPNKDFPLALTGTSVVTGLSYNWQSTTTPTIPGSWNSVGILNPTQAIATGNIAAPRWFRCIVTCTNPGGLPDTSAPVLFNLSSFLYCYCIPTYANGGGGDNITSVKLKNLLNNTTGNAAPYYHDYTSQQPTPLPIPVLTQGATDTVIITFGTDANQYNGVWIDFDRNGTFDTYEYFTSGTNAGGSGTAKVVFTTPAGGPVGITRMRVRGGDDSQPSNTQPCGASNSTWGEAEDYFVEIAYPPCNGPVDAGIADISDTASCLGYDVLVTDTSHEHFRSGIVWSWQSSLTNGSTWNDVAGSSGKDSIIHTIAANATMFRLRMICTFTGDTTYSNIVSVHIKPPYKCYCYSMATGKDKDSTDVGAFAIGNFLIGTPGGPHLRNPDAIKGRTDYTNEGPVQLYTDTTYEASIFQIMRYDAHGDAKITLFMDFNNNLVYDIPQERVTTTFTSINDWYKIAYITIPANVITDVPTGMRLIINSNTGPNQPSDEACGPYLSGETEDYVVMFKHRPSTGVNSPGMNITALQLYPNPSDGRVTLSLNTAKPVKEATVLITDITGRTVYTGNDNVSGTSFTRQIDLSGEARGMYLVTITADGEKMTRKLTLR